jgi:hypothetical protein
MEPDLDDPLLRARGKPAGDSRRHFALRAGANVHADVSEFELKRREVVASDQVCQGTRSIRRDQMVLFADQVQHWQLQSTQIDSATANFEPILYKSIFLVTPNHELTKCHARLIRAIEYPRFDAHEIFNSCPIGAASEELGVFLMRQAKRHQ